MLKSYLFSCSEVYERHSGSALSRFLMFAVSQFEIITKIVLVGL